MNLKPRRNEEPEINVTSLIDVVLLLVVFFMLSSNFTAEGRLRIRLPQASSVPTQQRTSEPLVVTVSASGTYLVNGRELINTSADTLREAIVKIAGDTGRTVPVTIRADGRASH
ncbi:MAG: ExbD/TolR family protein, partial [Steroidobacteraceae bacterium]